MLLRVYRALPHLPRSIAFATQTRNLADYSRTQFKLNTGQDIPALGFGTWQDKDAQEDAVYEGTDLIHILSMPTRSRLTEG